MDPVGIEPTLFAMRMRRFTIKLQALGLSEFASELNPPEGLVLLLHYSPLRYPILFLGHFISFHFQFFSFFSGFLGQVFQFLIGQFA